MAVFRRNQPTDEVEESGRMRAEDLVMPKPEHKSEPKTEKKPVERVVTTGQYL